MNRKPGKTTTDLQTHKTQTCTHTNIHTHMTYNTVKLVLLFINSKDVKLNLGFRVPSKVMNKTLASPFKGYQFDSC